MHQWTLKTSVAFLIFNRPDTTARVFEQIRRAKPPLLLVVADGPRPNRASDVERCKAARAVIDTIDWRCELIKEFADENLGCRERVATGLRRVFDTVEEAIVLEDDCLPHPSFFRFCEEMLDRYRDENRVMHITGSNFQLGRSRTSYSYYFSRYADEWGWASWRRAWEHFDVELRAWRDAGDRNDYLRQFDDDEEAAFWRRVWDDVSLHNFNTWGYQWVFAVMAAGGCAVVPNVNMISNIGFGADATHTIRMGRRAKLPVVDIAFPLNHPLAIAVNKEADRRRARLYYSMPGLGQRIFDRVRTMLDPRPAA